MNRFLGLIEGIQVTLIFMMMAAVGIMLTIAGTVLGVILVAITLIEMAVRKVGCFDGR